jgi:hypothetical protein
MQADQKGASVVANELDRDQYGVIRHHPEEGMLELEWLDASENMTDEDFKRSMLRFAALAAEQSTPHMLVDVTRFRFTPGAGVPAWRDEHVIPAYDAAGVEKFAFLVPAGAPGTVEQGTPPAKEPPGQFPTGYFTERARIVGWFRE